MVKPIQHANANRKGKGDLPNTNLQYMQEVHLVKPSPDTQVGLAQVESKEQVRDRDASQIKQRHHKVNKATNKDVR